MLLIQWTNMIHLRGVSEYNLRKSHMGVARIFFQPTTYLIIVHPWVCLRTYAHVSMLFYVLMIINWRTRREPMTKTRVLYGAIE